MAYPGDTSRLLSQPSGLKGATPSWRIWAVKARMTSSTGCYPLDSSRLQISRLISSSTFS